MSKLMRAWFVTSSEQTVWEVVAEESGEGKDIPKSGLEIGDGKAGLVFGWEEAKSEAGGEN